MAEEIERPRGTGKRTQPAREKPASAPDIDQDPGGHLAIGLMIGIIAIIALLTVAILVSIP